MTLLEVKMYPTEAIGPHGIHDADCARSFASSFRLNVVDPMDAPAVPQHIKIENQLGRYRRADGTIVPIKRVEE
jgi:hypothetical protein